MPDLADPKSKGKEMSPKFFLTNESLPTGISDQERRTAVARMFTAKDNPWFAKAMVNRIWFELLGESFVMPVDDMGPERPANYPAVLDLLAAEFTQSGYDVKWLLRTITSTEAYQREVKARSADKPLPLFAAAVPSRLRADELFGSLVRVLGVVPAAEPLSSRPKTVAALVAGAIGLATEQLLAHDPLIRLDAAAEDIHKARVATRRLRSDLKTLEPWCDAFRVEGLRQELRWLGELLGNVRDADVLPLTIATRAEQLADVDRDAVAIILARLAEDRRRALAVLRDVMGSARYLGLIADLERLAQQPPLRPEVDPELAASKVGRRGLAHAVGRVRKRIERLPADAGLEPLHEIRKAAKRARYAAELTSVLSRGRTDDAADRLADLQDQLGAMQDAVTAHQWLVGQRWPDADWQVAFTAGRLAQSFAADMAVAPTGWRRTWHRATDKHASRWYR